MRVRRHQGVTVCAIHAKTVNILCHPIHKSFHFSAAFKYLPFKFLRTQAYTKWSVPTAMPMLIEYVGCPHGSFAICRCRLSHLSPSSIPLAIPEALNFNCTSNRVGQRCRTSVQDVFPAETPVSSTGVVYICGLRTSNPSSPDVELLGLRAF
jgi:hypothetical protein